MHPLVDKLSNTTPLPLFVEAIILIIFLALFGWVCINLFKFILVLFGYEKSNRTEKKKQIITP
jgi:hypothetical protein